MMLSDPELEDLIRRAAPRDLPPGLGRSLARLLRPQSPRPKLAWAGTAMITLLLIAATLFWFSIRDSEARQPAGRTAPRAIPANHVEQAATYQPCLITPSP